MAIKIEPVSYSFASQEIELKIADPQDNYRNSGTLKLSMSELNTLIMRLKEVRMTALAIIGSKEKVDLPAMDKAEIQKIQGEVRSILVENQETK